MTKSRHLAKGTRRAAEGLGASQRGFTRKGQELLRRAKLGGEHRGPRRRRRKHEGPLEERRLWYFHCRRHPDRRCRSHFKAVAERALCATCRRNVQVPGQLSFIVEGKDSIVVIARTTVVEQPKHVCGATMRFAGFFQEKTEYLCPAHPTERVRITETEPSL